MEKTDFNSVLRIENLTKVYDGRKAVDDLSFNIERGEIFGLLGPNGAGKTTTVSLISCLIKPTSGNAWIDGASIKENPMEVKRRIGVVPQEIALYSNLTAWENLSFWSQMYDLPSPQRRSRLEQVLNLVGLWDRRNERIDRYSGGMKRRINIAVGLLPSPQLLILDEPTVGVDPQSRANILETLKDLNKGGLTILYTSHYMEEVEFLCTRVGIMDLGKLIALGTLNELRLLVGEKDSIRIFTFTILPQDLKAKLEVVEGADDVRIGDRFVGVLTSRGRKVLPAILNTLSDLGIKVKSIEVKEPNLENVFLHLTGKELRD